MRQFAEILPRPHAWRPDANPYAKKWDDSVVWYCVGCGHTYHLAPEFERAWCIGCGLPLQRKAD